MTLTKKIGIKLTADSSQAEKAFDRLAKKAEETAQSTKNLSDFMTGPQGTAMGFNAMAEAAQKAWQALKEVAEKVDQLTERTMRVNNVFNNLKFSIGAAREATAGLITDMDLATAANQAFSLGVAKDSKTFAELASAAQKLGARIDQGPKESLESLVAAVGRGSTAMLDNLGIVLKVEDAHRIYAAQLGKTTKELTNNERAESFRKVAIQKIIEAAKDVTIATDGSAAAVQRFKAELQNVQDAALGAEDKTTDLRMAMKAFVKTNKLTEKELDAYGATTLGVTDALGDAGVATRDLMKTNEEWKSLLLSVSKELEQDRKNLLLWSRSAEGAAKIMGEILDIEKRTQSATAGILREQRLMDIERELALHGNRKDRQKEINRLLNEQAELTAKQLELEGKLDEANRVRFENELRQIRSASGGGGGRGGRGRQVDLSEFEDMGPAAGRGTGTLSAGQISQGRMQRGRAQMGRAGEQAAVAQAEFEAEERKRISQEAEQEFEKIHQRRLQRIEEEKRANAAMLKAQEQAEARRIAQQRQNLAATASINNSALQLNNIAADAFIKGEARKEKAQKAAAGGSAITIGILEVVKAAAAFASLNFVQGAAHTAASVVAFAKGGQLLSEAGSAGRRGGGGGVPTFATGSAFGGSGVGTASPGASSTTGGSGSPGPSPSPPISEQGVQESGRNGRGRRPDRDEGGGGGRPINVTVIGRLTDDDAIHLRRQIRNSERKVRRVT